MQERLIAVVLYEGFQLLDLSGPADVFDAATRLGAKPPYRVITASPDGNAVRSTSGSQVIPNASLGQLARTRTTLDTLLVVGGLRVDEFASDTRAMGQLRRLSRKARRTTSVCSGALALAAGGLLDGYEATTHWSDCTKLGTRHPSVQVHPDRIFVHDRDRWTSAGVTAGIDLALALVEDDVGSEIAHAAAKWLVVFVQRPGGQQQFSVQLRAQPAQSPALARIVRWLPDHLEEDLSVEALAGRSGMSPRNFARRFREELGITPGKFVDCLRIEAAQRLLETTDRTVAAIASSVGIRHAETLHRLFLKQLHTTPDNYRQHFKRRAS